MTPTIVGGCIVVFALIAMVLYPRRLFQAIMFFAPFSNTAVVNFSSFGIAPAHVLFPAYLVWKFMSGDLLRPVRVSANFLAVLTPVAALGVLSVVSLLTNYGTRVTASSEATQTLYIVFGVGLTLVMAFELSHVARLEAAVTAMRYGAVFICLWGILQVVCFYTGIPYPTIFNTTASHFADMYDQSVSGRIARVASVTNEPSYLAVSLLIFGSFGSTLLVTEPRFRVKAWIVPVVLSLLIVLASTSTTGLVGLAVLAAALGSRRPGLVVAAAVAAALVLFIVIWLMPGFGGALYAMTFEKTKSVSYSIRYTSTMAALEFFKQQPLLGWGWGSYSSASLITQLLTSVGAIGSAIFVIAFLFSIFASRRARENSHRPEEWRLRAYAKGAENAMIVYVLQSVASSFHFVVADFWCLWALTIAIPCHLTPARRLLPAANLARLTRHYGLRTGGAAP